MAGCFFLLTCLVLLGKGTPQTTPEHSSTSTDVGDFTVKMQTASPQSGISSINDTSTTPTLVITAEKTVPVFPIPYAVGGITDIYNLTQWFLNQRELGRALGYLIGTGDPNDSTNDDLFNFLQGVMLAAKEGKFPAVDTGRLYVGRIMWSYYKHKYAAEIPDLLRFEPEKPTNLRNSLQGIINDLDTDLFQAYLTAVRLNTSIVNGTDKEKAEATEQHFQYAESAFRFQFEYWKPVKGDADCYNNTIYSWIDLLLGRSKTKKRVARQTSGWSASTQDDTAVEDVYNLTQWVIDELQFGRAAALALGFSDDQHDNDGFDFIQGMLFALKEGKLPDLSNQVMIQRMWTHYKKKFSIELPNILRFQSEKSRKFQNVFLQEMANSIEKEFFRAYKAGFDANPTIASGTTEEKALTVEKYFSLPMFFDGIPYAMLKPDEVDTDCYNGLVRSWKRQNSQNLRFLRINSAANRLISEVLLVAARFVNASVQLDPEVEDLLRNPLIQDTVQRFLDRFAEPTSWSTETADDFIGGDSQMSTANSTVNNAPSAGIVPNGQPTTNSRPKVNTAAGEILYDFIMFVKKSNTLMKLVLPGPIATFLDYELGKSFNLPRAEFEKNVTFNPDAVAKYLFDSFDFTQFPVHTAAEYFDRLKPDNVSNVCYSDVTNFLESLIYLRPWALKMFDSWAKLPPGLMKGQLHFPGSVAECELVTGQSYVRRIDRFSQIQNSQAFNGQYCKASVSIPTLFSGFLEVPKSFRALLAAGKVKLGYGACFPDTCSTAEITTLVKGLNIGVTGVVCTSDTPSQDGSFSTDTFAITVLCVVSVLAGLVVCCTLIDGLVYQQDAGSDSHNDETKQSHRVGFTAGVSARKGRGLDLASFGIQLKPGMSEDLDEVDTVQTRPPAPKICPKGIPRLCVEAFSLYTTLPALMRTEVRPGIIKGMDCIRFLSMCWIILGHSIAMNGAAFPDSHSNLGSIYKMANTYTFQVVFSGVLAVDTFFLLSGTLAAYLFLKQLQKSGFSASTLPLYIFHRYWRLTPFLLLVSVGAGAIDRYIKSGPMAVGSIDNLGACRENWWQNVLYFNNYMPLETSCIPWVWYLACDMHFYIIAPLIILPMFYKPIMGIIGAGMLILFHIGVNMYYFWGKPSLNYMDRAAGDIDLMYNTYYRSHSRVGPYAVGLLLGYILHNKRKMKRPLMIAGSWLLSLSMIYLLTHVQYSEMRTGGHVWSSTGRALYEAFHRVLYAMAVGWIVYALNNGSAGALSPIFNWGGWSPLSRLTYAAYLIHQILIFIYNMNIGDVFYVDYLNLVVFYVSVVIFAYSVGMIMSLIMEAPFVGLEKVIFAIGGKIAGMCNRNKKSRKWE